jgi:hypothetical protein
MGNVSDLPFRNGRLNLPSAQRGGTPSLCRRMQPLLRRAYIVMNFLKRTHAPIYKKSLSRSINFF